MVRSQMEVDGGGVGYLAESGHERRDLAVVCSVYVCACLHQQLHHVKMAAVGRQPQRGVALLVAHVNVSPSAQRQQRNTEQDYSSAAMEAFQSEWSIQASEVISQP